MARFSWSFVAAALLWATPSLAVWPNPKAMTTGSSFLKLSPSFTVNLAVPNAPSDLAAAVARTKSFIATDKLERLVPGRGSADSAKIAAAKSLSRLTVTLAAGSAVTSISSEAVKPLASRVESYNLTVPADGTAATLTAKTSLGLLRGLTTFEQLWYTLGNATYAVGAPIAIQDAPAFVRLTCDVTNAA